MFDKKTGRQVSPRYVFEAVNAEDDAGAQLLALSDRVRRGELVAFLEIGPRAIHPGEDAAAQPRRLLHQRRRHRRDAPLDQRPDQHGVRRVRMAELGIDARRTSELLGTPSLERLSLVDRDQKTGAIQAARKRSEIETVVVPMVMMLLLGMIVMVGAAPMLPASPRTRASVWSRCCWARRLPSSS